MPMEIRNCAEKAFFSAHGVSAEEVGECLALFSHTVEETDSRLSPFRRFLFRFLYAFK